MDSNDFVSVGIGDLDGMPGLETGLAFWVAGEIPALIDMPTTGVATYSGHAIGAVIDDGIFSQAVGDFTQTYNFATGSGPFEVTNFDGVTYNGGVNAISAQENLFTGSGAGASRDIELDGAFYSGGGDPVAAVGGGFTIEGIGYEASGIFAADKQP